MLKLPGFKKLMRLTAGVAAAAVIAVGVQTPAKAAGAAPKAAAKVSLSLWPSAMINFAFATAARCRRSGVFNAVPRTNRT